jgi:hypothetical protein
MPGENAEKAFNHIHPKGVCGSVGKVHTRMCEQPLFFCFVLVNVQVIDHAIQETQEIDRGSTIPNMSDHFALSHL